MPILLGTSHCAESESILFVRQVQARTGSGEMGCIADNSPTSLRLTSGALDVAFRLQYTADLLVGSQLVPRGNASQLRTETARVAIEGSVVRVEDAGGIVWGPVTVPGSGFIEPANGTTPSFGVTQTILLGAEFGATLKASLMNQPGLVRHFTAIAKVFGRTLGGMSVETGEWQFPLNVCYGCLISFPSEAINTTLAVKPNCDLPAATGTAIAAPCAVGQDDVVDCRVCKQFFPNAAICEPH